MPRRRLKLVLASVLLLVYVGSYIALSAQGRYVELVCGTSDGSQVWYPLGCENRTRSPSGRIQTDDPSRLGWLYLPLLLLDQALVHPTRPGPWSLSELEPYEEDREPRAVDGYPFLPEPSEEPSRSRSSGSRSEPGTSSIDE